MARKRTRLVKAMTEQGWTIEALAAEVPCDKGTIVRYRRAERATGRCRPSPIFRERLTAILGIKF